MRVGLLGSGLIGMFYTMALHGHRSRDQVTVVYSRTSESAERFAKEWNVPHATTDMEAAIIHPDVDVVIVALPNHLHQEAVLPRRLAKRFCVPSHWGERLKKPKPCSRLSKTPACLQATSKI